MTRNGTSFEQKAEWLKERYCADVVPSLQSLGPYFTPAQISAMLQLSTDTVIRMFEREAGVLVVGDVEGTRGKRRYRTLRVPESVLQRVLRMRTNV